MMISRELPLLLAGLSLPLAISSSSRPALAPCPGEGPRYGDYKCDHDRTHRWTPNTVHREIEALKSYSDRTCTWFKDGLYEVEFHLDKRQTYLHLEPCCVPTEKWQIRFGKVSLYIYSLMSGFAPSWWRTRTRARNSATPRTGGRSASGRSRASRDGTGKTRSAADPTLAQTGKDN